jgi:hypothetical protein
MRSSRQLLTEKLLGFACATQEPENPTLDQPFSMLTHELPSICCNPRGVESVLPVLDELIVIGSHRLIPHDHYVRCGHEMGEAAVTRFL